MTPTVRIQPQPDDARERGIRRLVREELASLGGHLLATYHGDPAPGAGDGRLYEPELATLGAYLLGTYGEGESKPVAYRDPAPPAVGEPPTTPAPEEA